jgi:hypothetical protein
MPDYQRVTDHAAGRVARGCVMGKREYRENFPYIIFHISFVIGGLNLEVQRDRAERSVAFISLSFTPGFSQVVRIANGEETV